MHHLYSQIHYWLVDHPKVTQFEFKNGHTFGSSPLFPTLSVLIYLSLTYTLHHTPLPTPRASIIRAIAAIYNLILILLSLLMAIGGSLSALSQMPHPSWIFCFPSNHTSPRGPLFFWAYIYYLSKFLEFTDTALIILGRKGNRQLTFLHVYHHAMVVVMCYQWLYSSQSILAVAMVINASVHVVMYGYYFLCSVGRRPWWKRLVTDCQLIQFLMAVPCSGVMFYYHFTGDGCSGTWAWGFNAAFEASLFMLFTNFHRKNYSRKVVVVKGNGKEL